jgi:hypothetical protein
VATTRPGPRNSKPPTVSIGAGSSVSDWLDIPDLEKREGAARLPERVTVFAGDIGQRRDTHTATMRTGYSNL